jgi:hypothetical protein
LTASSRKPRLHARDTVKSARQFIAIGPVRRGLVLVVYTERTEETVRIISARWAIEKERAIYRTGSSMGRLQASSWDQPSGRGWPRAGRRQRLLEVFAPLFASNQ